MAKGVLIVKNGSGGLVATSVDVADDQTITPFHLVEDGGDATQGALADAAWSGTGAGSVVALLKGVFGRLSDDPATETGLTAILDKMTVDPATGADIATVVTKLGDGTTKVISANPAGIYTDQQTVTATATQLDAHAMVNGFVVTASPLNVIPVFVGQSDVNIVNDGTGTGYPLNPGQSISFGAGNANAVWVIAATTGAFICVAGN